MNSFLSLSQSESENDWANFGRYEKANKLAEKGCTVFIGDSIIDHWPQFDHDYFGSGCYHNRGISGQVSSQMLVRFRRDVIDLKPEIVVILAGTNDIAQNNGYISIENIMGNIASMVELANANNIKAVLCSVLPASQYPWRPNIQPAEKIIALNRLIAAYANTHGIPYVDFHTHMKDDNNGLPTELSKDGVHPTIEGYEMMRSLLQPTINQLQHKLSDGNL